MTLHEFVTFCVVLVWGVVGLPWAVVAMIRNASERSYNDEG